MSEGKLYLLLAVAGLVPLLLVLLLGGRAHAAEAPAGARLCATSTAWTPPCPACAWTGAGCAHW